MIKNNKGVTLVELLIVIVVMGIIAAFAIPAVGTIIDNTQKDAIVADAIAIDNAANLYCAQTTCAEPANLTWAMIEPYVSGISDTYYEFDDAGTGDEVVASRADSATPWTVTLTATSLTDLDWPASVLSTDSATNRGNVAP